MTKRAGRTGAPVTVALSIEANRCMREEAAARGWQLVNLRHWEFILPPGIVPRGALVCNLPNDKTIEPLRDQGCAIVRIGRFSHPVDGQVPAVLPDNVTAGALAAEHFAERGFHDVAYFGRDPLQDYRLLYKGLRQRAKSLGMTSHVYRTRQGADVGEVWRLRKRQEFVHWLRQLPKPVGLLVHGDSIAAQYCAWAIHAGLSIPDEVAVLSRGNALEICESAMPTLSSLDMDDDGRIRAACDLLTSLMAGEASPVKRMLIPPKGVVERKSSNVLATPDRVVAKALRYMWDHFEMDLSVEEISREVGLSSSQLRRHFHHSLGTPVNEVLRRRRLEAVKQLLLSTTLSITDIAPRAGFRSAVYLHRTFLQAFNMTPAQYRRAHLS